MKQRVVNIMEVILSHSFSTRPQLKVSRPWVLQMKWSSRGLKGKLVPKWESKGTGHTKPLGHLFVWAPVSPNPNTSERDAPDHLTFKASLENMSERKLHHCTLKFNSQCHILFSHWSVTHWVDPPIRERLTDDVFQFLWLSWSLKSRGNGSQSSLSLFSCCTAQ